MKELILRLLGKTSTQSQQQISSVGYEDTACYRGQKYNPCVPVTIIFQRQSLEFLIGVYIYKYRGVSYVVEYYQIPTKPDKVLVYQR